MKKTIIALTVVAAAVQARAQGVGMNCQYFPAVQVGVVSVKATGNARFDKYRYGAGLPLLMVDRIKDRWYTNFDMSALYYIATQTNKGNDNRIKISKAEGAIMAGRLGYLFGDGDQFRVGPNLNLGWNTSNLDSLISPADHLKKRVYMNYGLGVVAYKKFGKLRVAGKLGFEKYAKKDYIVKGSGFYFEGTVGYSFYQKFGLSVMPCFYSRKLDYMPRHPEGGSTIAPQANAKVRSFVLRVGITKFF